MARVLFRMLSQTGHHNATFPMAKALKEEGHTIIYAAHKRFKTSVEENGFIFYEIQEENDILVFNTINTNKAGIKTFLTWFLNKRKLYKQYTKKIVEKDFFSDLIKDNRPDIVLIDTFLAAFALEIYKHNLPFFTVQILVSTVRMKNKPPLDSPYIPTIKKYSKHIVWLYWQIYYLRTILIPSSVKGVTTLANKVGFPLNQIYFGNYSTVGFKSIPEINTSPFEFDFPHKKPENHFYFRPTSLFKRLDVLTNYSFREKFEKIKQSKHPVVYCSFGSLSWRYSGSSVFFKNLLNLFSSDFLFYQLILVVEDDLVRRKLRTQSSDNVHIFKKVPQIQILEEIADLMINHGGINSITECIFTNTPMIVYPGSTFYDQVGNAARVQYHKIGLRGSYGDSKKEIKRKIKAVLETNTYKDNIKKMKKSIGHSEIYSDISTLINNYLKTRVKPE